MSSGLDTPRGRVASPEDAVAGVTPRVVFEPRTRDECALWMGQARAAGLALAFVGGKTALGLGAPPTRLDAVVSSRGLDRVVEYAPSDQVVVVEAGMTLAALQRVLSGHRQRLACDPPDADRATVGGLLATNNFGPLRTRFGSLRDLLLGVSVVRADGSVVRGGGKVVKNVAGFDTPKLMVGALGSLGMVVSAAFRVHPSPETSATLRVGGLSAQGVRAVVVRMRQEQIEPAAAVAFGHRGLFDLLVRFEGFSAGVAQQVQRFTRSPPPSVGSLDALTAGEAADAWRGHDAQRRAGNTRLKVTALPNALDAVDSDVVPRLTDALSSPAVSHYPTLGVSFVTGDLPRQSDVLARGIVQARASLSRGGGWLVVQDLPQSARSTIDVWGPPPPAWSLMKRMKERFDPEGRLNPGRYVGGL